MKTQTLLTVLCQILQVSYALPFETTTGASPPIPSVLSSGSSASLLPARQRPGNIHADSGQEIIRTSIGPESGTVQYLVSWTTADDIGYIYSSPHPTVVSAPIITGPIPSPTTIIRVDPMSQVKTPASSSIMASANIFQPVATGAPAKQIGSRNDHPVPRLGIQSQPAPLDTNKFYANFFLGSQTASTWTHPYSVSWRKGSGNAQSWGLAISHVNADQRAPGPIDAVGAINYFINPLGINSVILSALELGNTTTILASDLTAFSVNIGLLQAPGVAPAVTFPLVQGIGFVTGVYTGSTPLIQSDVFFRSVTLVSSPKAGVIKMILLLEDGNTWFLYAISETKSPISFSLISNTALQGSTGFRGYIQIAKSAGTTSEAVYDAHSGVYATTTTLSGTISGSVGTYSFAFSKVGSFNNALLMFALPHVVASLSPTTKAGLIPTVELNTTTKGIAQAIGLDTWEIVEPNLPIGMGFAPWSPTLGSQSTLSPTAIAIIEKVATNEVSQNMSVQTNLNSFYYAGKALAKFAQICYTINDLVGNRALAQAGLAQLKSSFELFSSNTNQYPLVYDSAWGGIVSRASYDTGDSGVDFGNTYYNDHHFHWSYFVYAASIIGYLDPSWLPANKDYVNTLVRDYANPSTSDEFFPVSRCLDWFNGHSWAKGLFESFDGKDEESSSEDILASYAIKMWGKTIGDANMEARGNLELAVKTRALQSYFLYTTDNTIEPANFIGNKVSGILFENKIDHTTYFGAIPEYIQGIHMLPLLPASTLSRTRRFVTEEWQTWFDDGRADAVVGGWKGILFANLAIIDPVASWDFFANDAFDASALDGGASRTWYLAFAAGLGGAP